MVEVNHFSVLPILKEGKHGNAVVYLEPKSVASIVNEDNVFQISAKHSKILYVHLVFSRMA